MLTLAESESRRNSTDRKRQKSQKRRKYDKIQKRTSIVNDQESKEEELKIHELLPVPYKPDIEDRDNLQTSFVDQDIPNDQNATISCVESVQHSNKFVIITLLDPGDQESLAVEPIIDTEITEMDKLKHKMQKKVILLHKIDAQGTATMMTNAETNPVSQMKDEKVDFGNPLIAINFEEFESSTTDSKDHRDIGSWIKRFHSLTLLYTEQEKPYIKCPACTAMFFKVTSFEKHVSSHLRKIEDLYVCSFCRHGEKDPSAIFTHLYTHQDQCEVCNMNLTRKNSFKKHWEMAEMSLTFAIKRDRFGRFVCMYCKLGFDLCHQLQKHWFKHSCNSRKTHQCNNCSGLFDTTQALENHICLKCPVCGKICDSVHRLRSHTRYEKHYLYCSICSYEFILAVDHEKHLALHKKLYHAHKEYAHCLEAEDGNSFQCEICGKIFHTMSCLVLHIHDDHKIPEASRAISEDELGRISLPEVKGATSYDIINTLKGELKCEVDFERACEEVLEAQSSRSVKTDENSQHNAGNEQCEPVSLCWNRYSINDTSVRKSP